MAHALEAVLAGRDVRIEGPGGDGRIPEIGPGEEACGNLGCAVRGTGFDDVFRLADGLERFLSLGA